MGCNCGKNRTNYEVVTAKGDVAFTSTSKTAAEGVAKRYPGSKVAPAAAAGGGKPAAGSSGHRQGKPAAGSKAG